MVSASHKDMCPGCSWCCLGEEEPTYPGFVKHKKAESSTYYRELCGELCDGEGKGRRMVDVGAWEEKNVPGAKEYYKEMDEKIKSRVWTSKRSTAHKK